MITYLLDTNHLSRLFQGHPLIIGRLNDLEDAHLVTCSIVRGEMMFMVNRSEKRIENLNLITRFFEDIKVLPVDNETADIYGRIKAAILNRFGPKEKSKRSKAKLEILGFTDNDLWIAAVAIQNQYTLVSADSDFTRISEIEPFNLETWWKPMMEPSKHEKR